MNNDNIVINKDYIETCIKYNHPLPILIRLEIYKELLDIFIKNKNKYNQLYMCVELNNIINKKYNCELTEHLDTILPEFNKDNIYECPDLFDDEILYNHIFWFKLNKNGYNNRIIFIKHIIKKNSK